MFKACVDNAVPPGEYETAQVCSTDQTWRCLGAPDSCQLEPGALEQTFKDLQRVIGSRVQTPSHRGPSGRKMCRKTGRSNPRNISFRACDSQFKTTKSFGSASLVRRSAVAVSVTALTRGCFFIIVCVVHGLQVKTR